MSACRNCSTYYRQLQNDAPWHQRVSRPLNLLVLLIGCGLIVQYHQGNTHIASVPWETLALVMFLGVMLAFIRPWQFVPRSLPVWSFVPIGGVASAFMDSFLVLVILASMNLSGSDEDLFMFRVFVTLSALIGGLLTYFGEVYALPIALMYGMREWYSMLWIAPPVVVFLYMLTRDAMHLNVAPACAAPRGGRNGTGEAHECALTSHPWERPGDRPWMILKLVEFAAFIGLLLVFKDPLLLTGIMLAYYAVWGHGMSAFSVWKFESEQDVLLLLVTIGVWAFALQPALVFVADVHGLLLLLPALINTVAVAVVYPATGNVYLDITMVSITVGVTPAASLVGLIVFKGFKEWKRYTKRAFPYVARWAALSAVWCAVFSVPVVQDMYYGATGFERPVLLESHAAH